MKGDKLVINEGHIRAAHRALELLLPGITSSQGRFVITIAGESGSGKSEIAAALSEALSQKDIKSIILQQDDYFVYPPKTNENMRRKDIGHVGMSEVRLDLIDQNLKVAITGQRTISKPLVIFDEDRITEETANLEGIKVVVVEGTYTTTLKHAHQHIFIDRNYIDTMEARRQRARETQDDFLKKVLEIEHGIIQPQKKRASIIITRDYEAKWNESEDKQS
ncbi:MAG: zeta toxin family protein [Dehalococcoidales bacterium]|nr:MAG: zeta toxin family protein [Dehalococcoidales bacterium]